MPQHKALQEILSLDPQRDHLRIAYLVYAYEFPFDLQRAGEFALFRTYAVPSISQLLAQTGEFEQRPQKRYDDTDLILSEFYEHGYDSERGRAALRRMNQMHGRFNIANDDMRYVLSTFVFELPRWTDRFGWRKMTRHERLAMFYFWREVGRRMGIKDLPETIEAFEQFNRDYERQHFVYAETNPRIGGTTRDLLLSWYLPRPLLRLGYPMMYALMDDPLLAAMGFPKPPAWVRAAAAAALKCRARLVALLPERRKPVHRTQLKRPTYPDGYRIEELGY